MCELAKAAVLFSTLCHVLSQCRDKEEETISPRDIEI